ncbi:Putative nuclease HARBI1 [Linum perenne]
MGYRLPILPSNVIFVTRKITFDVGYRIGFLHYATKTTNKMCVNMCRMRKRTFWKLCQLLKDEGGLVESYNMAAHEMLAIFLVTVGHNIKNRKAQFLFQRSAETISRTFKLVLLAILKLSPSLLEKPEPVPANCTDRRWKYFKGCLGALDGTMVTVRPIVATQTKYRNRKGQTAINVLGVCNTRMQFVYCLVGWPGSAHDSRILRDALARDSSFRIPPGSYYLCDVGYTNARGFLTPYRAQRYHLTEWGRNRPRTKEEMYNMRHAKARNVIECAFGVLKMRFSLLRDSSWFSPTRVGMIVNACVLLHNYIRREGGPDVFDSAYTPELCTNPTMTADETVCSMATRPKTSARTRAYKAWSDAEERALIDVLTRMYEYGSLKAGSLNAQGFADAEKRMRLLVPLTQHTADTIKTKFRTFKAKFQAQLDLMNASGMGWDDTKGTQVLCWNDGCRLPYWDDLCKIFEASRATGIEGMTPADAASRLEAELRATDSAPYPTDSYAADTTPMMEDLINQGFDIRAEGLKDMEEDTAATPADKIEKSTSGQKRSRQQATEDYLASIKEQMEKFQETITTATTNIERLTNTWCLPVDVANRRVYIMDEVKRLEGISYSQSLKAIRMLMKEPSDLETFCKMPTDDMKVDFILSMLE